jgi:ATP-dependent exoDNAse (exonuclease V) alpha subunit
MRIETIDAMLARCGSGEPGAVARREFNQNTSVVIDEASMLDPIRLNDLLRHCWNVDRIVLVGDPSQLPPVEAGSVLSELIAGRRVAKAELEKVRRTGPGSAIADLAAKIRRGELEKVGEEAEFVRADTERQVVQEVVERFFEYCSVRGQAEVQIVSPFNWLNSRVNELIRKRLCGDAVGDEFVPGDRVVCIRTIRGKRPISNGSIGTVKWVDGEGAGLEIQGCEWRIARQHLGFIRHGWAITIHKAQGTAWPVVIFALPPGRDLEFLDRALIYTGVTRAREKLIMVGHAATLRAAVNRDQASSRLTLLRQFAQGR